LAGSLLAPIFLERSETFLKRRAIGRRGIPGMNAAYDECASHTLS
jgi:hypothetical protein